MESHLYALFKRGGNPVHLSATYCLLWVAAADGTIDQQERQLILQAGGATSPVMNDLLQHVNRRDVASLATASQVLSEALTDQGRAAFLTLLIELAAIDHRLSISENHLLRFFADLLDISPHGLRIVYQDVTGTELPDPGDPSSITWWEFRAKRSQNERTSDSQDKQHTHSGHNQQREQPSGHDNRHMSLAEAYVVLGLRPDSTPEEIVKAYRRAVQSHHPDRFAELGPEAQHAAHEMFVRIRKAYEVLS